MKNIIMLGLSSLMLSASVIPSQAFWLEKDKQQASLWTVHCANREDYNLRGDHGDAVEFARMKCNELTAVEDHNANYRASVFY